MLDDADRLVHAVDADSPWNHPAASWWDATLNGERRVAIPWQTIGVFVPISTHPRVAAHPLSPAAAAAYVEAWLEAASVWVLPATERTTSIVIDLMRTTDPTANLIPDAQLAALALEHGLVVHSMDPDFARFRDVRWVNPLQR